MTTRPRVVLIADDDPDQRRILSAEIRGIAPDVTIVEARDGYEAVHLAVERGDITLAILDYVMPHMTGLQVAAVLKQRGVVCHVVTSSPISDQVRRETSPKDRIIPLLPVWLGVEHPKAGQPKPTRRDGWLEPTLDDIRRMLTSRSFATA